MQFHISFLSISCLFGTLCASIPASSPPGGGDAFRTTPSPHYPVLSSDFGASPVPIEPPILFPGLAITSLERGPLPATINLPDPAAGKEYYVVFKALLPPQPASKNPERYGWMLVATKYGREGRTWRAVSGGHLYLAYAFLEEGGRWHSEGHVLWNERNVAEMAASVRSYLPILCVPEEGVAALLHKMVQDVDIDTLPRDDSQGRLAWVARAVDYLTFVPRQS
ncbi:MAG: hypothetical protein M1829_002888 [Trizodia sp. TS-e1964]|nr:MAG: hypothetical protein M1829_002888 [Trizodia sp. TS-e1964]